MINPQKILVLCCLVFSKVHLLFNVKERECYKHDMKTESINQSQFGEMLDYGICNVTYRIDKIERLLFDLDYEVMDVTTQIFVNFS